MTEQWQTAGDEARRLKEVEAYLNGAAEPAPSSAAALFAALEEAAPQPSAAFGRGLFDQLRANRSRKPALVRRWLALHGGFDMRTEGFDMRRGLGWALAVVVLAVALAAAFAPAAQADFMATLRRIVLGEATDARQVEPLPGELPPGNYPWQLPEGTYWLVETNVGNFGANVLPGEDNEVRSVAALDEAEALTGVQPLAPTTLPAGYALREALVAPGRSRTFFQFYEGPGPDIVIVQTDAGVALNDPAAGESAVAVSLVTDGPLEEVTFDGQPAAWVDDHLLMWKADGLTFQVGGLGLDLPAAIDIARSLR